MAGWHRQDWRKIGPVFETDGETLQVWVCRVCGETRELYADVPAPRAYWHGTRR